MMQSLKSVFVFCICLFINPVDIMGQYQLIGRNDSIFDNYSILTFKNKGLEYNVAIYKDSSNINFEMKENYNLYLEKVEAFHDESDGITLRGQPRFIYINGDKIINFDEIYMIIPPE